MVGLWGTRDIFCVPKKFRESRGKLRRSGPYGLPDFITQAMRRKQLRNSKYFGPAGRRAFTGEDGPPIVAAQCPLPIGATHS